jgi:hypothetical protein
LQILENPLKKQCIKQKQTKLEKSNKRRGKKRIKNNKNIIYGRMHNSKKS